MKLSRNKRNIIILASVLMLTLAGGLLYAQSQGLLNKDISNQANGPEKLPKAQEPTVDKSKTTDSKSSNVDDGQIPEKVNSEAVITIDELAQVGSKVRAVTSIKNMVALRCNVVFSSPDSKPVTREFTAVNGFCPVTEISLVEFDKTDTWKFSITAYDQESSTTSNRNIIITR